MAKILLIFYFAGLLVDLIEQTIDLTRRIMMIIKLNGKRLRLNQRQAKRFWQEYSA